MRKQPGELKYFKNEYSAYPLLACLMVLALLSCGDGKPDADFSQAENTGDVTVEVRVIEKKPFSVALTYKSTLAGLNESVVKSGVNDRVEKVLFKIGDEVKKEDVVLQFPETNPAMQYAKAKQALDNAGKSYERVKEQAKAGTASQKELAAIEKQYNMSKQNFESIRRMIFVESPSDGTILEVFVKAGDKSAIGKELFKVGDEKTMATVVWVAEKDKPVVKPRMKAVLTVDGKDYAGRVVSVSDTLDPKSRAYKAELQFANPGKTLKSGTPADVRVITYESPSAVTIPSACILSEAGKQYVYVSVNGIAAKRYISTGQVNAMDIEVTSGLNPGDSLVTAGQTMLKDGDRVRVGK